MSDDNISAIQSVLTKINSLTWSNEDHASNDVFYPYIDRLMKEKDFPFLSEGVKAQFHKDLLAVFKEYIVTKERSKTQAELTKIKENKSNYAVFLEDTFSEFKDVYQGLISPPAMTKKVFIENDYSVLPPAPVA